MLESGSETDDDTILAVEKWIYLVLTRFRPVSPCLFHFVHVALWPIEN